MIYCYIILGLIFSMWVIGIPIIVCQEKRDFNCGICRYCNAGLRHFASDSQGGQGWVCDRCGFIRWTSWIDTEKQIQKGKINRKELEKENDETEGA